MSKIDRDSLLKFLSKPRFAHEVAAHYGISNKLAGFHLQKAVKSGHVLASERPVFQTIQDPNGATRKFGGIAYVFKNSPMLVDGWAKFAVEPPASSSGPAHDAFSIKFVPKKTSSIGERVPEHKLLDLSSEKTGSSAKTVDRLKGKDRFTSEFDVSSAKVKVGNPKTINGLLRDKARSPTEGAASLPCATKIELFKALSEKPLPFLDIHTRFRVSRQTVKRLVKNGLLTEEWGHRAVGLRFKLTEKGKTHLKELEAAARAGSRIRKTTFMRLKQRFLL